VASFKVISAQRQQRLRPDGGTTDVYVAWLETARGATGSVEVPAAVWQGDNLREYLQEQADTLDKAFVVVNEE
jgi:hypothetical protein